MSVLLTEPVVAGLVKRLTDNLAAAVTAVNAEHSDGVTVRAPDTVRILDHLPTLEVMTAFPVVGIGEGSGNFADDTGHSMTGRYQIAVCVYEADASTQVLSTRLRRLRLAVMRTVIAGRTLPTADGSATAAYGINPQRLLAGDRLADYDKASRTVNSLMGWCGFTIECLTDENT